MDKRTRSLLQRKKEARKVVQSDCLQSLVAAMQAMETNPLRRGGALSRLGGSCSGLTE